MTPTALQPRIPDALPVEVDPPRVLHPAAAAARSAAGERAPASSRSSTCATAGPPSSSSAGCSRACSRSPPTRSSRPSTRPTRSSASRRRIRGSTTTRTRTAAATSPATSRPRPGVLRSHFVLTAALRDPEVAALPMLKAAGRPGPVPRRGAADRLLRRVGTDQAEAVRRRPAGDHHDRQRHPRAPSSPKSSRPSGSGSRRG